MFLKRTVVMLPTTQMSKLYISINGALYFQETPVIDMDIRGKNQHLYLLSDEEIVNPCWCINKNRDTLYFIKDNFESANKDWDRIIASTDMFPRFPQSFIEKYVEEYNKNNIIKQVLVEYEGNGRYVSNEIKLLIETDFKFNQPQFHTELEKQAREFYWKRNPNIIVAEDSRPDMVIGFVAGATSKFAEMQNIEFAIEQLNRLDSTVQGKLSHLVDMANYYGQRVFTQPQSSEEASTNYSLKISGLRLAKEEIRREIKDLENKLKSI
jgi:hypothetical protein